MTRRLGLGAACLLLLSAGCGQVAPEVEEARGVLEGVPLVLAMTVLVVVLCGALIVAALGVDRFVRSRRQLEAMPAEEPSEEEEEGPEVVAGIGVGRAAVPRWLYGVYVVIPLFAFVYVFSNIAPPPPPDEPDETPSPVGPVTEVTVVARGILFDVETLTFPANTDVTVHFENEDAGVPHDLTFWESEAAAAAGDAGAMFATTGTIGGGGSSTLEWTTPEPGTYFFDCTIHPVSMVGDIVVE